MFGVLPGLLLPGVSKPFSTTLSLGALAWNNVLSLEALAFVKLDPCPGYCFPGGPKTNPILTPIQQSLEPGSARLGQFNNTLSLGALASNVSNSVWTPARATASRGVQTEFLF